MLVPKRNYLRHKHPDVALNECVNVFLAGLPLKLLARDKLFTSFLQYVWKSVLSRYRNYPFTKIPGPKQKVFRLTESLR